MSFHFLILVINVFEQYSPNSVNTIKYLSAGPQLSESKLKTRPGREYYHTDSSVIVTDLKPSDNVHHKVQTSPEVSFSIGLNTGRSVDQKREIKFCLAACSKMWKITR